MKDLFPVGLIYFIIIGSGMFIQKNIEINNQKLKTIEAYSLAIEINNEMHEKTKNSTFLINSIKEENKRLKAELKEHQDVKQIVKDIRRIAE